MRFIDRKLLKILPNVNKPGRYVGNELHIIRKPARESDVFVTLAFPDIYEIGMSHAGMQILYHVLNRESWIAAERCYVPWQDMEAAMREAGVPLYTLESYRPVRECDMLGVTLQYELQYTNILTLLDLAGIPLHAAHRDDSHPIVVAGGPSAFNPEPVAPFFDVVALGDGEAVSVELAAVVREAKQAGWPRQQTLLAMAQIKGVYVPSLYRSENGLMRPVDDSVPETVQARTQDALRFEDYPVKPLVPQIEITHDRFSLEIMRGCTRGCRFCNAGMIYRPLRTRSVDELVEHAKQVVANTGYDEVSLVSLSTSDYPQLHELLCRLKAWAKENDVSVSFPSLRSETFTEEMAELGRDTRRSSLTLAPEAGTQRLRDVINKNNTEADLLKAVQLAFDKGWRHVKLYFMLGLPSETDEDLQGIVDLVEKVAAIGRAYGKKDVHVALSPFSPKPHTPFQWAAQASREEINAKVDYIRQRLHRKQIKLAWRDSETSVLEGALGRGDRRMAAVVEGAWRAGARFDAWSSELVYERWSTAFEAAGLTLETFTGARAMDAPLPWAHLRKGVTTEFQAREQKKSFTGETTPDCRETDCQGCGLMDEKVCRERKPFEPAAAPAPSGYGRKARKAAEEPVSRKIRVRYGKAEAARFTSHLDTMRIFYRAMRRAGVQVAMSQGFHAHPKISSGPPLSLGYTSVAEYLDLELIGKVPEHLADRLNPHLPDGFEILEAQWYFKKLKALNAAITRKQYTITWEGEMDMEALHAAVARLLAAESHVLTRQRKGRELQVDIRPYIMALSLTNENMNLMLAQTESGSARPSEVLKTVMPDTLSPDTILHVERSGQFIEDEGRLMTPLEGIQEG